MRAPLPTLDLETQQKNEQLITNHEAIGVLPQTSAIYPGVIATEPGELLDRLRVRIIKSYIAVYKFYLIIIKSYITVYKSYLK